MVLYKIRHFGENYKMAHHYKLNYTTQISENQHDGMTTVPYKSIKIKRPHLYG